MRSMPARIYVLDDDAGFSVGIVSMLEAEGLEAEVWSSSEAFLNAWSPKMCGCILLNVRMPGMSGPECFSELLDMGNLMPVLFLTGQGDAPLALDALRAGAGRFLEKPVEQHKLLKAVRNALAEDAAFLR